MGLTDYTTSSKTPQAYNDLKARGFEVEQKDGQYFVKIDGKSYNIKPWDTVWTVTHRQVLDSENKEKESKLDARLKKLNEMFKAYCEAFDEKMDNLKAARHNFNTFLSNNHVSMLSQLEGTDAYSQGEALSDARYAASMDKCSALHAVLSTNNDIQSVCSQKMMLLG